MSEARVHNDSHVDGPTADRPARHPVAAARLLPQVTFGLGAAVLAGVVVTSSLPASAAGAGQAGHATVTASARLAAPINELTGSVDTTCCGHKGT